MTAGVQEMENDDDDKADFLAIDLDGDVTPDLGIGREES